jgi:DNA-binding NarL/FixJ family response regulator
MEEDRALRTMGKQRVQPPNASDDDGGRPGTYRILLVEDDAPVRDRLARVICGWPGGRLVEACGTLAQALGAIRDHPLDLLITDLKLPDGHGVQAIRALRLVQPGAEAMVISVLADDRTVIEAIEAGASGYLLKDSDPLNIIDAITDLLAGRSPISSTIARTIVRRLAGQGTPLEATKDEADFTHLTPREMDILWGIAKGLTYAELADRLQISKQTVPVHIKNIYRKLEANNRSEAVYEASRRGIIRL